MTTPGPTMKLLNLEWAQTVEVAQKSVGLISYYSTAKDQMDRLQLKAKVGCSVSTH